MRVVVRILAAVILALVLICAGAALYARTDHGRRVIANRLEHVVSEHIPGTMKIGRLDHVSLRSATVSDLRFLHPNGSLILRVKHASIDFDLGAALHRELVFKGARVNGGFLLIGAQPSGRTGLEETFSHAHPKQTDDDRTPKNRRGHYLRMQLRDLHVRDMTVAVRPSPKHPFHLERVSGVVAIEHLDTRGVRVRLDGISGDMPQPKFLGKQLDIVSADGWVHGAEPHVIDLEVAARFGDGRLDARFDYFHRHDKPVEISLAPKSGTAAYAGALAGVVGSWFTHAIHVEIEKS